MNDIEKEYIHGDKFYGVSDFIFSDMVKHSYDSLKDKSGVIFCKTDYLPELFANIKDSKNRYVLITHNSDFSISEDMWHQRPTCVKVWFAQNVLYSHPNLIPIPIGMERPLILTHVGIRKGDNGDIDAIINAVPTEASRKKDVLMAFTPATNSKERNPIIEHFSNVPWVTYLKDRIPFKNYINILKDHKYVLSPEGNGPDCIRTWEALYLEGVVPIVKRGVLTEYFKELPILIVDDFRSLTIEQLNESYDSICRKRKDMATMSYWFRMLQKKVNTLT